MARIVLEHESGEVVVAETTNMDNTRAIGPVNEQYWLSRVAPGDDCSCETWEDTDGYEYYRTK